MSTSKVHTLDIDSSHRDPVKYENPNDYVITLESPIYDISQIRLVSARIPTSQLLICSSNQSFEFRATHQSGAQTTHGLTLPTGNYTTGDLAAALQQVGNYTFGMTYNATRNMFQMASPIMDTNANQPLQNLVFLFKTGEAGYDDSRATRTTPHQIFGLPAKDVSVAGGDFGAPNLDGPNSLVIRISSGSEELNQTLPTSGQTPYYTGHVLLPGGKSFVNVNGNDDKVTHDFHSGTLKSISDLRIQFFYMSHGRLIPYDFRNQDHILKFEITCSTDKLKTLSRKVETTSFDVPEPIRMPEFADDSYDWVAYLPIVFVLLTGFILIRSLSGSR